IAIIGIGCRFPGGASSPKAFWKMLCKGTDAIIDVPPDRWDFRRFYDADPDKPGKTYAKQGGFLKENIYLFDPMFFGISPREAETLDPMQRLLLEVTWEAFEDAGLIPEDLTGSGTGVFVGGFFIDNAFLQAGILNKEIADSHTATSSSLTMLSNRISYTFDLKGPSLTIDTACSSSLVAIHYACQSIRNEESDLAIAGGANVMLRPEFPIVLSKGKFLSTHSRSMAFDERAEGYARGEGAAVVLLKSLSNAIQDKDPIYALIRMSGVNQDGRTVGISLPNADSQKAVMKGVYKKAGVSPGRVQYVEAHGTGTQAGDMAEMEALHAVLSEGRESQDKCNVGSVKTNMGHLEAGAGIAGLIKATLCLKHKKIPPNLHFEKPNPKIPFKDLCVKVPTKVESWPSGQDNAYAAVNSFGYGGTNAHVLLEEAPRQDQYQEDPREEMDRPLLIPVSAKNENALKELAGKYAFTLTAGETSLADLAYSTSFRRTHHNHRLTVVAQSEDDLRKKLLGFSMGDMEKGMSSNQAMSGEKAGPVFVYTGMGPQWWAMGRELREKEPVFRETLEECDALFREIFNWSLMEALGADEESSRMAETEV
ncbi:MAG: type I polyketide synthase, partial [Deltaproteobacteria bacterium]|nr:type I polyketide synthase [Deltaproteobacteria bacterium]